MKIIKDLRHNQNRARVLYDGDWFEYRVMFYCNGQYADQADYYTDDKADAIDTAKAEILTFTNGV